MRQREDFAMNALEEVLLWLGTQNPLAEQGPIDSRVRDCVEHLCRNLGQRTTMEGLAAAHNLSVSRLAHLFREQVGVTPQQFLEQQRMARAKQLLELSGRGIADIASEVGFDSPFYFTQRFKHATGVCPRDYRKRSR